MKIDRLFLRVFRAAFEQRQHLASELRESFVAAWMKHSKEQKIPCVYAAVVFDPIAKIMRVYVGKGSGTGLYGRWRAVTAKGGTNTHIRDLSRIFDSKNLSKKQSGQYCDQVFAANIDEQLKSCGKMPADVFKNVDRERQRVYVFVLETPGKGESLDLREAHWALQLGVYHPDNGLNSQVTKYTNQHAGYCESCAAAIKDLSNK